MLVKGMAAGKTMTQAALDAGYGRGVNAASAAADASRTLNIAKVSTALESAFARVGLSIDDSIGVVKDAHVAEKITYSITGEEFRSKDHGTRLRAAEMNMKLNGYLRNDEEKAPQVNLSMMIVAMSEERARRALNGHA